MVANNCVRVATLILVFAGLPHQLPAQLPELTTETMAQYRAAIEPTAEERSFLEIDWFSELCPAVQEAHRAERPLLVYVMNGHPLGCT
jgi:hypothetical protein